MRDFNRNKYTFHFYAILFFSSFFFFPEKDYPPKADAGSNQVIFLPQNSIDLYGNKSSDDKGEIKYEWIKTADDKLTAGMTVGCNLFR